jgi:hypothetical protein
MYLMSWCSWWIGLEWIGVDWIGLEWIGGSGVVVKNNNGHKLRLAIINLQRIPGIALGHPSKSLGELRFCHHYSYLSLEVV